MHPLPGNRSRGFVALQHNSFSFKSAADTNYDGMKAKPNSVHLEDLSPPRSQLSDLSRLAHAHLFFQSSIDRREHSLESCGTNYPRYDYRSPEQGADLVYSSPRNRPHCNSGDKTNSVRGSYNYHGPENVMKETISLKRPHIDEDYSRAGQKHGTCNLPAKYAENDTLEQAMPGRCRYAAARSSPTFRLATIPQGSSLSAASMATTSRFDSYMSALLVPPSESSADICSHPASTGLSFNRIFPPAACSPFATRQSLDSSPQGSVSRGLVDSRGPSGSRPGKIAKACKASVTNLQALHLRKCCSSRRHKFNTAEKLAAHESEKQYGCRYCGYRFKTKSEAEGHEKSLHIRLRSWSCSALLDYRRAFHESTNRPGEADVCGYCGDEFARTGVILGTGALSGDLPPRCPTDQDWDERGRHLQDVHKFRECNATKKFYRADHMRQHIKHCHGGICGKWSKKLTRQLMTSERRLSAQYSASR